ncbi:hypothetical protein Q31a_40100 [Aureliella helgolandensis]|uniref:Uncharacterized protein n=2 Tax=Aureliella helgolandensis TaxID=2527968 RepID=A0A518GAT8_9BACT|nr:hypothetical protein Q31a_40100 [Aureliella helgolandensis]
MTEVMVEEYQQYRAPSEDGASLIAPSLERLVSVLNGTAASGQEAAVDLGGLEFCGKPWRLVREQARAEAVALALDYTSQYLDVAALRQDAETLATRPVVMSGHQPELFHPGVWFKNFLLSSLAEKTNTIAINFLVDNDLCRSTSIRVPTHMHAGATHQTNHVEGESTDPFGVAKVPFDELGEPLPWELRTVQSHELWDSFPDRVERLLNVSDLAAPESPALLRELWTDATESLQRTSRPGLAIAEARHRMEHRLGLRTLEVPLSQLVATRAFARFSIQLLSELPRFQEVYNDQLGRYRSAHRIRNHAHPVPALEQEQDWLEAPWWVYRADAPKRQKLWVRMRDAQLILSDRSGWQAVIEGRLDCDNASAQWLQLLSDGVCLRPRALLTTMYSRLIVSDMFLHGIGGGKYDQLTDAIVGDFFGIAPPPMAVASATLHLPMGGETGVGLRERTSKLIRQQEQRLWELKFHADQVADLTGEEAERLRAHKQELLNHIPEKGDKWEWHRDMTRTNQRLSQLASDATNATKARIAELIAMEKQVRIAQSREYSFCLYPRKYLAQRLREMAR